MKSNNLVKIVSTIVGIVIAMFFVVLVVADPDQDIVARSPLLGQPAPAVTSETIDGEQFVLERRKGSWVVLNFFNSTCVPCINEHDLLVDFANSEASNLNGVREFFNKNGGDWQKVKDDNGAIAVAFGVARVPETWIIDPNGMVRLRITGELSPGLLSEQVNKLRDGFTS